MCSFSPELKPNKITDDEDNNKSSIELRRLEPLLIANKKMSLYVKGFGAATVRKSAAKKNFAKKLRL